MYGGSGLFASNWRNNTTKRGGNGYGMFGGGEEDGGAGSGGMFAEENVPVNAGN